MIDDFVDRLMLMYVPSDYVVFDRGVLLGSYISVFDVADCYGVDVL